MNIEVSQKAREELVGLMTENDTFLRIEVIAGGCAGLTYRPGLDSVMADDDEIIYDENGLKIVADMRSALYLQGLEIDYSDDLINAGFRFSNPHATKSCGCGQSFQQ